MKTAYAQSAAYWGLGDMLRTIIKNTEKSCNIKKNSILNGVLNRETIRMNIYT